MPQNRHFPNYISKQPKSLTSATSMNTNTTKMSQTVSITTFAFDPGAQGLTTGALEGGGARGVKTNQHCQQ